MFLLADTVNVTVSVKNEATIYFTYKDIIEITVDVGCASPGVTFTWNRPMKAKNSSKPCSGNPYFSTSKSIFRMDNPIKDDAGTITLSVTHPTLKPRNYTWNLKG